MRRLTLPLILGLAHGLGDGAAGYLLGGLPRQMALEQVALLVLVYNVLAFGGQPLAGMLADWLGRPRAIAAGGMLLLAAGLAVSDPTLAVLLAGLGSAAFHVGGGALALQATSGRAAGPGLFAAPGVVGLAFGGILAAAGYPASWLFAALLLCMAVAMLWLRPVIQPQQQNTPNIDQYEREPLFERHDLVMLGLLAAIALRSAVWSSLEFLVQGRYELLLSMALAAATGKLLGGLLADRLGWRRWAIGALLVAAPLLSLGSQYLPALLLGIALLQSVTPVALAALAQTLPRSPATAAGLGFGAAIALGGLPVAGGFGALIATPLLLVGLLLAAALALWRSLSIADRPIADSR